jgi:poly-gamma-glutamate synthesis protein (capsule biosynthesis protein)
MNRNQHDNYKMKITGGKVRRPRRNRKASTAALLITAILLTATLVLAFNSLNSDSSGQTDTSRSQTPATENTDTGQNSSEQPSSTTASESDVVIPDETDTVIEAKEIELVAVGDVLLHMPLINGVKRTVDGEETYLFSPVFRYIESIIQSADYATFNFEGTLAGAPYSGYPMFSAPDEIVPALKLAGFDLASTINNHSIDRGYNGLVRTAEVFMENGFPVVGTRTDLNRESFTIKEIEGINIGFASYSFETIGNESGKSLNGITVPAEAVDLIDSFNPYRESRFDTDLQKIVERVNLLKDRGADLICLNLHWGDEYNTRSNDYQKKMSKILADAGVDLIIGHHPHVVQEIDVVASSDGDNQMLVYYSLGNFVSNQYYDTGNAGGKGQDGIIARITIRKDNEDTKVTMGEYIPIHVVRVTADGIPSHRVVPVLSALDSPGEFETTAALMQSSLERTSSILADSTGDENIPVQSAAR